MNEDAFAELSAGHALGALSDDDERAFRDALAAHPAWQTIVDADLAAAAALADAAPAASPPPAVRAALLAAVAADAADAGGVSVDAGDASGDVDAGDASGDAAAAADAPPTRRAWRRGLFALVASIALLVGIGWGTGALSSLWNTSAPTALEQIEQAPDAASAQAAFDGGTATVHWSPSLGKTVLVADGLPAIADDQTFELWYVRGGDAVPAGTFDAQDGRSTAELTGTMRAGDTIAVTVEPAGGAPGGTPSGAPVLAVPTAGGAALPGAVARRGRPARSPAPARPRPASHRVPWTGER